MNFLDDIKSLTLLILIAIAAFVRSGPSNAGELQTLTVAGGCFWCVEANFEMVDGVTGAVSGFTGGKIANPTYKQVSRGDTGHFEAVRVTFDPTVVDRATLFDLFLRSVDPTDADGQFCDRGDNYRSAIFVSNPQEKALATQAIKQAEAALGQKIVTPVLMSKAFYPADDSHQNYYKSNRLVLTRFGPKTKATAYKLYREACGRDKRVKELWGSAALFAGS